MTLSNKTINIPATVHLQSYIRDRPPRIRCTAAAAVATNDRDYYHHCYTASAECFLSSCSPSFVAHIHPCRTRKHIEQKSFVSAKNLEANFPRSTQIFRGLSAVAGCLEPQGTTVRLPFERLTMICPVLRHFHILWQSRICGRRASWQPSCIYSPVDWGCGAPENTRV